MKPLTEIPLEQWKDIPGFTRYQVSDQGRFRRQIKGKWMELTGKVDRLGYHQIGLMKPTGTQQWFLSHRVIACTFTNPELLHTKHGTFLTVNHKNRIKTDNRLVNLELITVQENHQHWRKTPLLKMASLNPLTQNPVTTNAEPL